MAIFWTLDLQLKKCDPPFNIYASITFQWYTIILNLDKIVKFTLLSQNFGTCWNSNSQGDSHFVMLRTHLISTLPHFWECVWVPRHYVGPHPFSCLGLGHKPKTKVTTITLIEIWQIFCNTFILLKTPHGCNKILWWNTFIFYKQ